MEYREMEELARRWRWLGRGVYVIVVRDSVEARFVSEMLRHALRGFGITERGVNHGFVDAMGTVVGIIGRGDIDRIRGMNIDGWMVDGGVLVNEEMLGNLRSRMR